jgi:hypothetical protein
MGIGEGFYTGIAVFIDADTQTGGHATLPSALYRAVWIVEII